MHKRTFILFSFIFILIIITPIALNRYYNYLLGPQSNSQQIKSFIVKPGQPITQIAQNLQKANLIKNALAFRLLVAQMGIGKNIQAGDFQLSANLSAREIATTLTHGAIDVWITFPEGKRVEEMADIIEAKLNTADNNKYQFDKKEFIKGAQEGYMFPDTYLIAKDSKASDLVTKLRSTFDSKVDQRLLASGAKNNLKVTDVVTLASIIEREAKSNEEKPIIAGIILNRLNAGIALQIDATVQYAKGYDRGNNTWWPQISVDDYSKVNSPYNTYLHPGLPPGPIANPGIDSLKAAAKPADTPYLYYLHDSEGKIHYAKTIQEHEQNIQKYL